MHSAASTRWRNVASLRSLASASWRRSAIRARLVRSSVRVERLEEVVGGALSQGGDRALEVVESRHDDHGGGGSRGLEPGHELLGGRVGEPAVEDDRREPRPVVARHRLGGTPRRRDAVIVELEDVAQVVPRVRVVLDHQDVHRRARLPWTQRGLSPAPSSYALASCSSLLSSSGTSNGL